MGGALKLLGIHSIISWERRPKQKSTSAAIWEKSQSQRSLLRRAGALLVAKKEASVVGQRRGSNSDPTSDCSSRGSAIDTPSDRDKRCFFESSQASIPPETKHVSFNEQVRQAQAVESLDGERDSTWAEQNLNSDLDDDGGLRMSPSLYPPSSRWQRTIMPLPSTTPRYAVVEPETTGLARPDRPSHNFFIDDDNELLNEPLQATSCALPYTMDEDLSRMRRTGFGMFMPYDEYQEDTSHNNNMFGRVSGLFDTAKDMAHLLWKK